MKNVAGLLIAAIAAALSLASGTAGRTSPSGERLVSSSIARTERPEFTATIDADNAIQCLNLQITNRSAAVIGVDWNATAFIDGEATRGGFMFEGVTYLQREGQRPADSVFPGTTLAKRICPNVLVSFVAGQWVHAPLGAGVKGAYLALQIDGAAVRAPVLASVHYAAAGPREVPAAFAEAVSPPSRKASSDAGPQEDDAGEPASEASPVKRSP